MISYKSKFNNLQERIKEIENKYDELLKETKSLLSHIQKIKRKCENENLWLMAGLDPYKPLIPEEQQGPMVTKLFGLVTILKKKVSK